MSKIKTIVVPDLGDAMADDVIEGVTYTSDAGIRKTGILPVTYEITEEEYNKHLAKYKADSNYIFPESGKLFSETHFAVLDDYSTLNSFDFSTLTEKQVAQLKTILGI